MPTTPSPLAQGRKTPCVLGTDGATPAFAGAAPQVAAAGVATNPASATGGVLPFLASTESSAEVSSKPESSTSQMSSYTSFRLSTFFCSWVSSAAASSLASFAGSSSPVLCSATSSESPGAALPPSGLPCSRSLCSRSWRRHLTAVSLASSLSSSAFSSLHLSTCRFMRFSCESTGSVSSVNLSSTRMASLSRFSARALTIISLKAFMFRSCAALFSSRMRRLSARSSSKPPRLKASAARRSSGKTGRSSRYLKSEQQTVTFLR
mmetsp:Transcript_44362/g.102471  ORF Transcript_44362/g.102471 Transcript_44362/m.102471 type:complete len:264 (+) Transcript_44362:318-1109(+)